LCGAEATVIAAETPQAETAPAPLIDEQTLQALRDKAYREGFAQGEREGFAAG